ncbi:MAG: hypothetical protein H6581_10525 [Bacteroidia bacterium]|nr:hypothetical protein [Bacteroidia bacterium]
MSSAEIKMDIIRLIDQVEDNDKLKMAYRKLLNFLGTSDSQHPIINEQLEESLNISLKQMEDGKVIPHEEVMAKYRTKYGR